MKAKQHLHAALGVASMFSLSAVPALAQSPAGIAGVIAPSVAPELVQEGFVFTEGPVGTQDGGLYFSDIRVNPHLFSRSSRQDAVVRRDTTGPTVSA